MTLERFQYCAAHAVPDLRRVILAAGNDPSTIWRVRYRPNLAIVPFPGRLVLAAGNDTPTIWREWCRPDLPVAPLGRHPFFPATGRVPHPNRAIAAACSD